MKYILGLLIFASFSVKAGFCDNAWGKQTITGILVHGSWAYINIEPGLTPGHDSTSVSLLNEVALNLTEDNKENIYPMLLTASVAKKKVTMSYCDGSITHGYKGGDNTLVKVRSVKIHM